MNKLLPLIFLFFFLTSIIFTACKKNESLVAVNSNIITDTEKIVVLGSSTAAGKGASTIDSCWVNRLQAQLKADQKKVKIINLASGGYTTYQILPSNSSTPAQRPVPDTARNITKALSYNPSLVLINMPTNDIASDYSDDEIISNFKKVTDLLSTAHISYIITGTQPRNFSNLEQRLRLKILNDKLLQFYNTVVDDYLNQISTATWEIIDRYSAGDGTHLNDKGHYIIYHSIFNHSIFKKILKY